MMIVEQTDRPHIQLALRVAHPPPNPRASILRCRVEGDVQYMDTVKWRGRIQRFLDPTQVPSNPRFGIVSPIYP